MQKKIDISKCEKLIRIVNNPKGNMIYVHGFSGNFSNKNFLINYYREYNFFAINLPGHGDSKFNNEEIDFFHYVEVIKEFINELSLNEFILIGHSMGGAISIVVSQYFQKQIKLLILESPANITILDNWSTIKLLIPKNIIETTKIYNQLFYKIDSLFNTSKQKERFLLHELNLANGNDHLRKMLNKKKITNWMNLTSEYLVKNKVKTIVLLGQYDGVVKTKETITFFSSLNMFNYQIFIIKNSAHLPWYENRNDCFQIIDKYI